jgi:hypothetical protein
MKRAFIIGALLAVAAPGAALADEFSYSNFEVSWIDLSLDGGGVVDVNGDGLAIEGSYDLNKKFFLLGEYQDQSYDFGIDGNLLKLGAGIHHELSSKLDFVGTLSYFDQEVKFNGLSADDNGLGIGGGIRSWLGSKFQLDAMLNWVDWDEAGSDTGVSVMGRFYFTNKLALSFGTNMTDDVNTMRVGFRAEF